MKVYKSSSSKKMATIISVVVVILAIAGCLLYYNYSINKKSNAPIKDSSSQQPSANGSGAKTPTKPTEGLPSNSSNTTTNQIPNNSTLSVSITYSSESTTTVQATASTSDVGTCVFLYQPGDNGKPVTRQIEVTNKTCSASIPLSEFTYIGQWKLTVTYYNNGNKAEASQDVTIN